ncbi:MAG TPA: pyridoxal-phosphate dependent enzyme [Polyangiaceae bacterium]|nr:pyridoxal-phosphate dependent enzyme [Polyangiaceae bacterium]
MTALFDVFPQLRTRVSRVALGDWPTRVEYGERVITSGGRGRQGELWLKRDDLCSPIYGGNKVRLLEHLLGEAQAQGVTRVLSTGATGSNFVLATTLHAARAGLAPGAICFPEPLTAEGELSQRVVAARAQLIEIPHWSLLPLASERARREAERAGESASVLSQVSFTGDGLLGYLAAGLELGLQLGRRECPVPAAVVLPIGSSATTAGVLAGLSLARRRGIFSGAPEIHAVRIAAWPLSRRGRVLGLARRVLARVAELSGDASAALSASELLQLTLVTDQLGRGYPFATPAGTRARSAFADAGFPILDDTYSAKAAAHALELGAAGRAPLLFWCTKSSAALPDP